MGPVVVDGIDPMNQVITVRVNGKEASSYNTKGAIFGLQHYIARMSQYVTLWPGDVIWLGCDGPTLPALEPGDLVEVVNDAIGVLANRVVRA
jgi:2-keto-4-pentenoate hydratase/2-oxohepta-3-ene-1,7-dioic acid hydratase in catechol pathway